MCLPSLAPGWRHAAPELPLASSLPIPQGATCKRKASRVLTHFKAHHRLPGPHATHLARVVPNHASCSRTPLLTPVSPEAPTLCLYLGSAGAS